MELFGIFIEAGSQRKASREKVSDVVDDVISATEYIANYYNVEIQSEVPSVLRTPPMYKSETYSIIINLVTNSIKAVGASGGKADKILIRGTQTDDGIQIRVYDTGVGIPKTAQEEAFEPLISDPADNIYTSLSDQMPTDLSEQLGRGTGLGLSIVRNIAEKYGGNARFVGAEDWSTCVEVTVNE
jgi:signal transduction histidine kinase